MDLDLHCLLHISLLTSACALASVITLRGQRTKRTSTTAAGAILITPVIARPANLRNLLSSTLLTLYVTLGHQTVKPLVNIGLMTIVYVQYTTSVVRLPVLANVPLQVQKVPQSLVITLLSRAFHANNLSITSARYLTSGVSLNVCPEKDGVPLGPLNPSFW